MTPREGGARPLAYGVDEFAKAFGLLCGRCTRLPKITTAVARLYRDMTGEAPEVYPRATDD